MAKTYGQVNKTGLNTNVDATAKYMMKSVDRGGKSSIVKGGTGEMFTGGPQQGDKSVGTKRFDITNRSLNRRGM